MSPNNDYVLLGFCIKRGVWNSSTQRMNMSLSFASDNAIVFIVENDMRTVKKENIIDEVVMTCKEEANFFLVTYL